MQNQNQLHLSLSAGSPQELIAMIRALAAEMPGLTHAVEAAVSSDGTTATMTVQTGGETESPRSRRGKTKAKDAANENADAVEPEPGEAPTTPLENPASTAQPNVVSDLTPEKARTQAIEQLQQFFGRNPNNMSEITKLQQKYGVKLFKDVTEDRAAEFLADVKLLTSGNAVAA